MHTFWVEIQTLSDLWLHRTVPCLDLYHELHGHLEDSAKGDISKFPAGAPGPTGALKGIIRGSYTLSFHTC